MAFNTLPLLRFCRDSDTHEFHSDRWHKVEVGLGKFPENGRHLKLERAVRNRKYGARRQPSRGMRRRANRAADWVHGWPRVS